MATALLNSAGCKRLWEPSQIAIAEPVAEIGARHEAAGHLVVDNPSKLPAADCYFLCVKPQDMEAACTALGGSRSMGCTPVVSIAAGVTVPNLAGWLGGGQIVRTMPNTPLLVGHGFTFAHGPEGGSSPAAKLASDLFSSVGGYCWLTDENLLDAATALSGSGPAYAYLVIETMASTAAKMGIEPKVALEATLATLQGACEMVSATGELPEQLRRNVTSKGGTTAAALQVLEDLRFAQSLDKAMIAAEKRGSDLSGS